jgi:hypothetical protein
MIQQGLCEVHDRIGAAAAGLRRMKDGFAKWFLICGVLAAMLVGLQRPVAAAGSSVESPSRSLQSEDFGGGFGPSARPFESGDEFAASPVIWAQGQGTTTTIQPMDANGQPIGQPISVSAGPNGQYREKPVALPGGCKKVKVTVSIPGCTPPKTVSKTIGPHDTWSANCLTPQVEG